jgi:stage V sporulation protein B
VKNGFVKGAIVLAAAGVICRLLGVAFRIPLSNIVGNYGIGLYQLVFPLYSLLLIISSAGMPVAISKMVARERENKKKCKKILFNSAAALSVVGLIISVLFMVFARPIADFQGKGEIWILYIGIAPSVFFVCFISAFRGYFQGMNNMWPTAISQITEQIIKVGAGLTLAVILVKKSVLWAVFGAVLAVSISELAATLFLFVFYIYYKRKRIRADCDKSSAAFGGGTPDAQGRPLNSPPETSSAARLFQWSIVKQIFTTSAPITLMSIVFPLVLMFDSFFVVNALTHSGAANATELYGVSSGAVHTLINLPTVIGMAIATALVPTIARNWKDKKTAEMKQKSKSAILLILIFSVLSAVIYAVFAPLILKILYSGAFQNKPDEFEIGVKLLRIESIAIVLICLSQVITSILQGVDKSKWPLIALAAGGTVKILWEVFTIGRIGIAAVSIANVLCFALALLIGAAVLFNTLRKRK